MKSKLINIYTINQYLSGKVHLGTKKQFWNVLIKNFLFGSRNGLLFYDIKKTLPFYRRVFSFLKATFENHQICLFVGSHDYVSPLIRYLAINLNQYSITNKWVGGTLTNWLKIRPYIKFLYRTTVSKIRNKFILRTEKKIEQKLFQYTKMKNLFFGVESMPSLPNLIILFEKDVTSYPLKEAFKLMIPIIKTVNTNHSSFFVSYPLFGNDFLIDSIYFQSNLILQAMKDGLYMKRLFFIKKSLGYILKLKKNKKDTIMQISNFDSYLSSKFQTFFRLNRNYQSIAERLLLKKYAFIFHLNQKEEKRKKALKKIKLQKNKLKNKKSF
jgi:small subunit ribosomal protein S2